MPPMSGDIARGGGVEAGIADLVLAVKLGPGQGLLQEILARRAAAARARQEGLSATPEEIQDAVDAFFTENDLFEAPQQDAWMKAMSLSREALSAHFAEVVLADKLREHLVPDSTIEAHFKTSRHDYARADVEVIEFEAQGAAAETALQLREGEIAWAEAAARAGGLESRTESRREAPEEVAAELFSAAPGSFLGPVETDEGGFAIYRLVGKSEPELDDDLREEIRARMFGDEMQRAFSKQPIRILA
jgi:hypothetical protein